MENPLKPRVMNLREARENKINLDELTFLDEGETPYIPALTLGFARIIARRYIERHRKKAKADLAIISQRSIVSKLLYSKISYKYDLYIYRQAPIS